MILTGKELYSLDEMDTQRKLGYNRGFEDALDKVIEAYDGLANDDVVSVGLIRLNALDLKIQIQKGSV